MHKKVFQNSGKENTTRNLKYFHTPRKLEVALWDSHSLYSILLQCISSNLIPYIYILFLIKAKTVFYTEH